MVVVVRERERSGAATTGAEICCLLTTRKLERTRALCMRAICIVESVDILLDPNARGDSVRSSGRKVSSPSHQTIEPSSGRRRHAEEWNGTPRYALVRLDLHIDELAVDPPPPRIASSAPPSGRRHGRSLATNAVVAVGRGQHPPDHALFRTSNVECRTSNVERRTSNVECRTSNVERRTSNVASWMNRCTVSATRPTLSPFPLPS